MIPQLSFTSTQTPDGIIILIMENENYDGMEWEIEDTPIGSSTPDELYELSYRAKTKCPDCGDEIQGTAYYWSRESDMSFAWLERIDYEECGADENEEEDDDYEDE